MRPEEVGQLKVVDLLVHPDPEVQRLAQEVVALLAKREEKDEVNSRVLCKQ